MIEQGLFSKLIEYGKSGNYAFHMPGHKRNDRLLEGMDPFQVDITEITGFDNLHHAEEIIKISMENAARYFGTDRTWFLVNGSSCGILAAIHSITDIGDSIVIGRNCHKAVYNAALLRNLDVKYLYPDYIEEYGINGGYNPNNLEKIFAENKNVKAVVITSPTYDGIISDVKTIAEITHRNGAVLIVDEAHGAHLGISDKLPVPAYEREADLVIESVHKTLPSLTQTALLHLCGDKVRAEKIEESLGIYETSSPSYLFMGSIDKCIRQLQTNGKEQMDDLLITVNQFRDIVNTCRHIRVPGKELKGKDNVFDVDATKIIIYVDSNVSSGKILADILREKYHFEMEMVSVSYVLGITTISDNKREIIRLANALKEIDKEFQNKRLKEDKCCGKPDKAEQRLQMNLLENKMELSVYEADKKSTEAIRIENSAGRVTAEFLYLYPPGIPLLVPGEVISEELLQQIKEYKSKKMNINGLNDKENRLIKVIISD